MNIEDALKAVTDSALNLSLEDSIDERNGKKTEPCLRISEAISICRDYLKKQREICAKRADNCLAVNENKYFGNLNLAILNSPEPE